MKVLYLIHYAGSGGAERYVELLADRVPGCGLCCTVEGPLSETLRAKGIPVHPLKMSSPLDLSAARALAALCRREGYDVIHAQFPRENALALLSQPFGCKARVVYTAHLIQEQPLHWRVLNRLLTPRNHCVIAVCQAAADALRRNGVSGARTRIIPNGIDTARIPPRDRSVLIPLGITEDEPVLIALTRFSPEKGLGMLCDAIAALKRQTALPFRVLLAGDGEELPAIRAKVRRLGLSDTILLPGYRADAPRLLSAADVYLNTSESEAMSFAILEAMAAALPVVATAVGGTPDLIDGTCGILIPPRDADACADALRCLLEDPALRRRMGGAARQRAEHRFRLEHTLSETTGSYEA